MLHNINTNVNSFSETFPLRFCIVYDIIPLVYRIRNKKGGKEVVNLAQERKSHGMTQEELAAVSGVHRVTIARIETGDTSPKAETLKRLADALGVLVDDLMDGKAG